MNCSVCHTPLTERQVATYNRKHGKRRYLKPPPVCSPACAGEARRSPPKQERPERWAREVSSWDSTPFVGK